MRLLVVEDVVKLADALKRGLSAEGYAVDVLHDGAAAHRRFAAHRGAAAGAPYDLLILDVMLPGVDGLQICRDLRSWGFTLPILMLTARDAVDDRVAGLDSGADDYLIKPFAFEELLARIRTLLRRPHHADPPLLAAGTLVMNPVTRDVKLEGKPLTLSPKEYGLLHIFLRHQGEVLSRDWILEHLWDEEYSSVSNTVDVYVARLRRKVDLPGEPSRFETVRGAGYRMRA